MSELRLTLFFYGTECQSFALFWFLKYRVTELRLEFVSQDKVTELRIEFVSRDRLSETYFVVNDQSKATWNARQRIKLSSTLPRDPKTSSGALQELNKASAFWPYQFLQRAAHLDKPNSISPGQVTFWRTHAAASLLEFPASVRNTYNATPEPGYIVRQSLRSFNSDSWPKGADCQRENRVNWC